MELKELILYRSQLLNDSLDDEGYISDAGFIENCLPWLVETKHIETTDVTNVYDPLEKGTIKTNAYVCNESGERLQLFLVNEESLNLDASEDQLLIAHKAFYDKHFNRALSFVKKSIKKHIQELLQDASPSWVLVHQLADTDFLDQIDVIEIFLLSATASIESRGASPTAKMLEFDDESITVNYTRNNQKLSKDIVVMKRLIDLNFLYNVHVAQDNRYPLIIDFEVSPFNYSIPVLHAASESDFDSYLCAFPASLLAELYKKHSSRLLEKNVRSFLQLKGVNKGMQETIRKEPEKFIAYNNGLTITATANETIKINGIEHLKSLSDFQIVNGGQTTATLYFSKKQGLVIDTILVMAKINVAKNASEEVLDDLISNISTFSNAQSKVSKVDLRARSSQLVKLKSLSESILTISSKKWFFERAKGEYATMLRINQSRKTQIEKAFPKERRFTKEELAKYYSAWGDKPYAVKKGGEKIFRLFLEEISGEGKSKKAITINRVFYEDLIARIILFRSLEKMYGSGNNSLGQLRSAVVPYTLSALYINTTGKKKEHSFDLLKIWKAEKVEEDLQLLFKSLMKLINKLIKKYSKSDDLGEYSKKIELWEDIRDSKELNDFIETDDYKKIIKKYCITADELKNRQNESSNEGINFEPLLETAAIFDRGVEFYKKILNSTSIERNESIIYKLEEIIAAIRQNKVIEKKHLEFEKELVRKMIIEHPDVLLDNSSNLHKSTVNLILKQYNSAISSNKNIQSAFEILKELAHKKGVPYSSVFGEIGKALQNNELPSMQHINQAKEFCKIQETI